MKVLLTVHQFLPEYYAGTEILTFNTAKVLQNLGHEVAVFCAFPSKTALSDAERFDRYEYQGISVFRFHHDSVPMGSQQNVMELEFNNLLSGRFFRNCVEELKPDIVHFFHLQRISASAIDICHDLNIPMVLTPTDFWFVCLTNQLRLPDNSICPGPDRNSLNCLRHMVQLTQPPQVISRFEKLPDWLVAGLVWLLNKGLLAQNINASYVRALSCRLDFLMKRLNLLDRVFVPTHLMQGILTDSGLIPRKTLYAPFGIDLTQITFKVRTNVSSKLKVGFIGTLYEHKGPHILVKALCTLAADAPVELRIYGKDDEYPEYVAKLKELAAGDKRISFCGAFPNNIIGHVFSELDVLVVPSVWYENTPLVIYTAQAAGCPVIASNLGGMSEVILHGENGLLFEPGNIDELAAAINSLAHDRKLLQELSKNSRKPNSIEDYVALLLDSYLQVLEERTVAGPTK